MNTLNRAKKQPLEDWHAADIKAALEKSGWTLSRLAKHHGYFRTALTPALRLSRPTAERLIAEAIGVDPEVIWPARYAARKQKSSRRGRRRNVKLGSKN